MKARIETVLPPGLPPCLHRLTAPCYLHRAAQWKVTALLGLALALVLAGLGYWAIRLPPRGPDAASLAFAAFLLLFLVLLGRRAIWRSPIVVAADRQGLFFVGSTEGVLVPWQETGPLTIERARTSAGVSECVGWPSMQSPASGMRPESRSCRHGCRAAKDRPDSCATRSPTPVWRRS
ncbi:hypothetical protein [Methyloversatilis sp.]|uniref:hypothetical protein n=1 Tax=Methyloversatilis sp. TaxID=2569862 RepID=UPI0035B0DBA1